MRVLLKPNMNLFTQWSGHKLFYASFSYDHRISYVVLLYTFYFNASFVEYD